MLAALHHHHQNDLSIEMGSSESHFNVSLIVRGSRKERPQTTAFEERAEAEFF